MGKRLKGLKLKKIFLDEPIKRFQKFNLKNKMKTFEELGIDKQLLQILDKKGFKIPTEIQDKSIPLVLAGKDVIGSSATGSGKTLAFSSGIIQNLKPDMSVQALILTPTRELAEQVTKTINSFSSNRELEVLSIYGGVDIRRQIRRISTADIIVGTPGRILDHLNRRTLRLDNVGFLVLDEVDRMFDMGFHHDVEKIIRECPVSRQTMLFSATISGSIDHFVQKYTKDAVEIEVESYVDTTKLKQVYYDVPSSLKFSLLVHLLKEEKSDLVMVFCNTKRNVDFITHNLIKIGINAGSIHGGLTQARRNKTLQDFHKKRINVLVCTDVAARGLDIKEVSHVYNYDLPKIKDDYVHRIGRTARAGDEGSAINILSDRDYDNFRNILKYGELDITPVKLPYITQIPLDMRGTGRSSGRDDGRGSEGRYGRGGSRGRDSRGPRSGGSRRYGGGSSRGSSRDGRISSSRSSGSRSPRKSGGRFGSDSRGSRRDSGSSRGGPRRSSSRARSPRSRHGDSSSRNSRFRRNDSSGPRSPRRDSRRR